MSEGKITTESATPSPFVPLAEGLGPQELYYCQLEAMLGTLVGRLLVVALYCLVIAGWQGALIGTALLLVLGWGQILRHKDRPDLLRYNRNRYIWAGVAFVFGPLLIRLFYAALQAWAPSILDAWLEVSAPAIEHLSRHLSTFEKMRQVHAQRFAATPPVKIPHLDLALHMQMLHWLSLPVVLLFSPLIAINLRQSRPISRIDRLNILKSFLGLLFFILPGFYYISNVFNEMQNSRMMAAQFSFIGILIIQIGGFLLSALLPMCIIILVYFVMVKLLGVKSIKELTVKYWGWPK